MKIYPFSVYEELLKIDYDNLKNKDWDCLSVCCGHEGIGKSKLTLFAIELWFKIKNIPLTEENFKKAMGVKLSEWSMILRTIGKYRLHTAINVFDEAGDVLSGKHANNKVVRAIEDSLKVIRGLNLMTILVTPSLFILSPYIRNWRVRVVYYVSKRGVCNVYFGKTLQKLIAENENSSFPNMFCVNPDICFKVPLYEGVFLKPYVKMKNAKMYEVLVNLDDVVNEDVKKNSAKIKLD